MPTKYKYPLLAKPSGITLEQHKLDVMQEGRALCQSQFLIDKYKLFTNKDLGKRLLLVCEYHDWGKRNEQWQSACQKDYESFLANQDQYQGENLLTTGVRHEAFSAAQALRLRMPLALVAAIAAHHAKLNMANQERWQRNLETKDVWTALKKESWKEYSLEEIARHIYEYSSLRSLLQFADHRASAREEGEFVPDLHSFKYTFPHSILRPVQKLIAENWSADLLLLRAPTGAGKTDASLLWAKFQIENMRADRLVIAMPTRFTSNALAINVSESLSETGLYHSSAWNVKKSSFCSDDVQSLLCAKKEHELARRLSTPVTVCTLSLIHI